MKASELRIGYWYNFKGYPFIMTDDSLSLILRIGGEYNWTPIQLTEEWVIRLGGIKEDDCVKCYKFGEYSVCIYDSGISFWVSDCDDCGVEIFIEYVHQLQNLYFALKGNELTIK